MDPVTSLQQASYGWCFGGNGSIHGDYMYILVVYTNMCMCIHVHIHMYRSKEEGREREREGGSCGGPLSQGLKEIL